VILGAPKAFFFRQEGIITSPDEMWIINNLIFEFVRDTLVRFISVRDVKLVAGAVALVVRLDASEEFNLFTFEEIWIQNFSFVITAFLMDNSR